MNVNKVCLFSVKWDGNYNVLGDVSVQEDLRYKALLGSTDTDLTFIIRKTQ